MVTNRSPSLVSIWASSDFMTNFSPANGAFTSAVEINRVMLCIAERAHASYSSE
jgi:hypothetical protein